MVYDLLLGVGLLSCTLSVLYLFLKRSAFPLPPGPKRLPIIGNVHQIPLEFPWLTFQKWGEQYGDICCAMILRQPMIILNSMKTASDILEKTAGSGARPRMVMASELVGFGDAPPFTNDMELHKAYRRLYTRALNQRASQNYWPIQLKEARMFVARILDTPDRLKEHIRRASIGVIALISHGYQIQDNDYFVWLANKNMENFLKAAAPGGYLVDVFPFLRFAPAWLPGAHFKREAAVWRKEADALREEMFGWVKANMANGTAKPSYTSALSQQDNGESFTLQNEEHIKWSAAALYTAGSDTSGAAIHTFVLAMLLYPAVQAKAQAELDEVVGKGRMPTFDDKERLVYCTAIVKETLRWQPVAPVGMPRSLTEDVVYEGYRLPKGSIILPNVWNIMHDPKVYPSPDDFMPERFLSPDGLSLQSPEGARDFSAAVFGFGKRVCPGSHVAENTMFIAVASILWACNIRKPLGPDGKPIHIEPEYLPGFLQQPKDFDCVIESRSVNVAEIVRQAATEDASS